MTECDAPGRGHAVIVLIFSCLLFSCDADPDALAKYVLALIKKEKTEKQVRLSMIDQLDVFLQGGEKCFCLLSLLSIVTKCCFFTTS